MGSMTQMMKLALLKFIVQIVVDEIIVLKIAIMNIILFGWRLTREFQLVNDTTKEH